MTKDKWVIVLLLLVSTAVLIPAVPTTQGVSAPYVALSPNFGGIGQFVNVTATGFNSTDTVCAMALNLTAFSPGPCVKTGSGQFFSNFTVTNHAIPGPYIITVAGSTGDTGYGIFTVGQVTTSKTTMTQLTTTSVTLLVQGTSTRLNFTNSTITFTQRSYITIVTTNGTSYLTITGLTTSQATIYNTTSITSTSETTITSTSLSTLKSLTTQFTTFVPYTANYTYTYTTVTLTTPTYIRVYTTGTQTVGTYVTTQAGGTLTQNIYQTVTSSVTSSIPVATVNVTTTVPTTVTSGTVIVSATTTSQGPAPDLTGWYIGGALIAAAVVIGLLQYFEIIDIMGPLEGIGEKLKFPSKPKKGKKGKGKEAQDKEIVEEEPETSEG